MEHLFEFLNTKTGRIVTAAALAATAYGIINPPPPVVPTVSTITVRAHEFKIEEVRLFNYENTGALQPIKFSDMRCGPAPRGWTLEDELERLGYCSYSSHEGLVNGQEATFTIFGTPQHAITMGAEESYPRDYTLR